MTESEFSDLALKIALPGLILLMGFIVWDLAKKSQAGRFGTMVLFGVLGLGVFGFIIKEVLVHYLGH